MPGPPAYQAQHDRHHDHHDHHHDHHHDQHHSNAVQPFASAISLVIWWIFGGIITGIIWFLLGLLLTISIVGFIFGWAQQCFKIAMICFWPEGASIDVTNLTHCSCKCGIDWICNYIWLTLFGWELAISHFVFAILLFIFEACGIHLSHYHFDLAWLSLFPFGSKTRRGTKYQHIGKKEL